MRIKLFLGLLTIGCLTAFGQESTPSSTNATLKPFTKITQYDGEISEYYDLNKLKYISVDSWSYHNDDKYVPSNLLDGNNATAWVANEKYTSNPQTSGVGSSVNFHFSDDSEPVIIEIVPGYLKSEKTWSENSRISKVRITYLNKAEDMNETIIDVVVDFELENGKLPMKSQYINLMDYYIFNMAMTDFNSIRIEILEVEAGSKYDDACISTINFYSKGARQD